MSRWVVVLPLVALMACGRVGFDAVPGADDAGPSPDGGVDAGTDAGGPTPDAGADAGAPPTDAGPTLIDAGPGPGGIVVDDSTPGLLIVEAARVFRLVFDQESAWQAASWTDLSVDPSLELAGRLGVETRLRVVQAPIELFYVADRLTISNATEAALMVLAVSPNRAEIQVDTAWAATDGTRFSVVARYTIDARGTWLAEMRIRHNQADPRTVDLRYGITNVSDDIPWTEGIALGGGFSFTRDTGPTPRSVINVTANGPSPAMVGTEVPRNRFLALRGLEIPSGSPVELSWTTLLR